MKRKYQAIAAVSVAAVLTCGVFAGCDLVTQDVAKNMNQEIAVIDITKSDDFTGEGQFADYKSVISPATIYKRDMMMTYMTSGYSAMQQSGWSYADTFEAICDSLVNQQIFLQYAQAYLLKNGYTNENGETTPYTVEKLNTYLEENEGDEVAYLSYYLTEEERGQTEYNLKVFFNNTLDAQEPNYVKGTEDEEDEDTSSDSRTTPTGIGTEDEDYYDPNYKIFTGTGKTTDISSAVAAECGSYEAVEGSTSTSRRSAYGDFLSGLRNNSLLRKNEDVTDISSLSYYKLQRKTMYESALISKLTESLEYYAEQKLKEDDYAWAKALFNEQYNEQKGTYEKDTDAFETALDSVSDTNFLLYTPDVKYGFVINILLPFSATQSAQLSKADADFGDKKGNKFETRARLLKGLKATDQRGAWFGGDTEYPFEAAEEDGAYKGESEDRNWLFFKDQLAGADGKTDSEYEPVKNYIGKYTYNGTVVDKGDGKYKTTPNKITIDDFIDEMKGYMKAAAELDITDDTKQVGESYYTHPYTDYYGADGKPDYSKFLYYEGKVKFTEDYDVNKIFKYGTEENKAFSVINELSFAYNTDTAGLNSYLGYAVSPYKTDFVKEFEWAAQKAVSGGAGTITVAPSDYGWHIMYCTFSYAGGKEHSVYTFNKDEVLTEGTFSYQWFESLKSSTASNYASRMRSQAITSYDTEACCTVHKERYEDWSSIT